MFSSTINCLLAGSYLFGLLNNLQSSLSKWWVRRACKKECLDDQHTRIYTCVTPMHSRIIYQCTQILYMYVYFHVHNTHCTFHTHKYVIFPYVFTSTFTIISGMCIYTTPHMQWTTCTHVHIVQHMSMYNTVSNSNRSLREMLPSC